MPGPRKTSTTRKTPAAPKAEETTTDTEPNVGHVVILRTGTNNRPVGVTLHLDGEVHPESRNEKTIEVAGRATLRRPDAAADDWAPLLPAEVVIDGPAATFLVQREQVAVLTRAGLEVEVETIDLDLAA